MTATDPLYFPPAPDGPALWFGPRRFLDVAASDFPVDAFALAFQVTTTQSGTAVTYGFSSGISPGEFLVVRLDRDVTVQFSQAEVRGGFAGNLLDGERHHIGVEFGAVADQPQLRQVTIWVDGSMIKKQQIDWDASRTLPNSGALMLGVAAPSRDFQFSGADLFNGRLSDVHLYRGQLGERMAQEADWVLNGREPNLYFALPLRAPFVDRARSVYLDLSPAQRDAHSRLLYENGLPCVGIVNRFADFPLTTRTVALWMNAGSDALNTTLLSYGGTNNDPDAPNWSIFIAGASALAVGGLTIPLSREISLLDGSWHHVAVVVGGGSVQIYVDGVLAGNGADTAIELNPNERLIIGTHSLDPSSSDSFTGALRRLGIWRNARSADDILDDAWGAFDLSDDPDLLAGWSLREVGVGDALQNPPTEFSAVKMLDDEFDAPLTGRWRGYSALVLDATQQARFDNPALLIMGFGQTDFSIAADLRMESNGGLILSNRSAGSQTGFELYVNSAGQLVLHEQSRTAIQVTTSISAVPGIFRNRCRLIAIRTGATVALYANSATLAVSRQSALTAAIDLRSDVGLTLGGAPTTVAVGSFRGEIYAAAVWSDAQDAAHIGRALSGHLEFDDSTLVTCWRMRRSLRGTGSLANDLQVVLRTDSSPAPARFVPTIDLKVVVDPAVPYAFLHAEARAQVQGANWGVAHATHELDVPPGCAFLYAALTGVEDQFNPPAGVQFTLTDPAGTRFLLEQSSDSVWVHLSNGQLRGVVLRNPAAGTWRIELAAGANDEFALQLHAIPAQDVPAAMVRTLNPLFVPPDSEPRQRTLASVAVVATAILAGVAGMAYLGISVAVIAPALVLVCGAAVIGMALTWATGLGTSGRLLAVQRAQSATINAGIDSRGSLLQILDLTPAPVQEPGSPAQVHFDLPSGAWSLAIHLWLPAKPAADQAPTRRLEIAPPSGTAPVIDPFLSLNMPLTAPGSGLRQGYCGVALPRNASALESGRWSLSITPGPRTAGDTQLRVAIRTPGASGTGAVPTRFHLKLRLYARFAADTPAVATFRSTLADGLAELRAHFANTMINIVCEPTLHDLPVPTGENVLNVLSFYDPPFPQLLAANQDSDAVSVLFINNAKLSDDGARGCSQVLSPLGFAAQFGGVLVKVGGAVSTWAALAHELGHTLGLPHESACLGQPGCTIDACRSALKTVLTDPSEPLKAVIGVNVMHPSNPGATFNPVQIAAMQRVPFLLPDYAP